MMFLKRIFIEKSAKKIKKKCILSLFLLLLLRKF